LATDLKFGGCLLFSACKFVLVHTCTTLTEQRGRTARGLRYLLHGSRLRYNVDIVLNCIRVRNMERSFTQWRDSSGYRLENDSVVISDSDEDVADSSREIDKVIIDESIENNDVDEFENTTPRK